MQRKEKSINIFDQPEQLSLLHIMKCRQPRHFLLLHFRIQVNDPLVHSFVDLQSHQQYQERNRLARSYTQHTWCKSFVECAISLILDDVLGDIDETHPSILGRWCSLDSSFDSLGYINNTSMGALKSGPHAPDMKPTIMVWYPGSVEPFWG